MTTGSNRETPVDPGRRDGTPARGQPRQQVVEPPAREQRDAEQIEDRQPAQVGVVESGQPADEAEDGLDAEHARGCRTAPNSAMTIRSTRARNSAINASIRGRAPA